MTENRDEAMTEELQAKLEHLKQILRDLEEDGNG